MFESEFILLVLVNLLFIYQGVFAQFSKCPDTATFPEYNLQQIVGEWIEVQSIIVKQYEKQRTMNTEIQFCNGLKIEQMKNQKLNYKQCTNLVTSTYTSHNYEVVNGWFAIQNEAADSVKAEAYVRGESNGYIYNVEKDGFADSYSLIMDVDPAKYLVYVTCRVRQNVKESLGTIRLLARRTNDSTPAITEDERNTIMYTALQNTKTQVYKNITTNPDCFNINREYLYNL